MLPTIDLWGFVRKALGGLLKRFANPITLLLVGTAAGAAEVSILYNAFSDWVIPHFTSIPVTFDHTNNSLLGLLFYITNVDRLIDIINFVISFLNFLIPFMISFWVGVGGVMFMFRVNDAFRAGVKDLLG